MKGFSLNRSMDRGNNEHHRRQRPRRDEKGVGQSTAFCFATIDGVCGHFIILSTCVSKSGRWEIAYVHILS